MEMRRKAWQWKRFDLLGEATEELRIEQSCDGKEEHSGAQPRDGEARISRELRRKGVAGIGKGNALICSARRWKCTAEPRSAKDRHCEVERGEGEALRSLALRRHSPAQLGSEMRRRSSETDGSAKDWQRTDAQRHWVARP